MLHFYKRTGLHHHSEFYGGREVAVTNKVEETKVTDVNELPGVIELSTYNF